MSSKLGTRHRRTPHGALVPIAGGATIFADGFESGDTSAWGGSFNTGATLSELVTTNAKHDGVYGLAYIVTAPTNNAQGFAYKAIGTMPASNKLYLESWWNCAAFANQGATPSSQGIGPVCLGIPGGGDVCLWLAIFATTPSFKAYYKSQSGVTTVFGSEWVPTLGTWYRLKMLLDRSGAQPVVTWWTSTDGASFTQQGTATDATAGSAGIGQTGTLEYRIGAPSSTFNDYTATLTWYADTALVTDADPDSAAHFGSLLGVGN